MSFEQCVYYAVLMASLTLDRPALKSKARWMGHWLLLLGGKPVQASTSPSQHLMQHALPSFVASQVISSPEVLSVIDSLPHVREFASALYESRYADFFRAFAGLLESLRTDCFLHAHSRYFQREVRVKVYSQVG